MATISPYSEDDSIFHASPCTLLELASTRLALHIWIEKFHKYGEKRYISPSDIAYIRHGLQLKSGTFVNVHVPYKIKKIIESHFDSVTREMISWHDMSRSILKYTQYGNISSRFDLVVLGGNGRVHVEDTIAKFFEDDATNIVTKFELACAFCLEEKIDFYWRKIDRKFFTHMDKIHFHTDFMLCYWVCRNISQSNRATLDGYKGEIERIMIELCCRWRFYLAAEFFLKPLDLYDQLVEIYHMCNSVAGFRCVKYLLPRLEPCTQRYVFVKEHVRVLTEFIEDYQPIEYVVQAWLHLRDFITDEVYCTGIILPSIRFRNTFRYKDYVFKYKYAEKALTEIWLNTSDNTKKFAIRVYFSDILRELSLCRVDDLSEFNRDISFLLSILSDTEINVRNQFWIDNWPKWIEDVPPGQFLKLMSLCLVQTRAIEEFSFAFMHTDIFVKYCDKLMSAGLHSELDEFLSVLDCNQNRVSETRKYLLAKGTMVFESSSLDVVVKHTEYIDYVYSKGDLSSKDFKQRLICSEEVLNLLGNKIANGDFDDVIFIVGLFVSSTKGEEKIIKKLLEFFRGRIIDGRLSDFDEWSWQKFLTWCLNGNKRKCVGFMDSLPINSIFEEAFSRCLCNVPGYRAVEFSYSCKTQDLNKFLTWYFKSKSACEEYKRERVFYYKRMDAENVQRIFGRDKNTVVDLMKKKLLRNTDVIVINLHLLNVSLRNARRRFRWVNFLRRRFRDVLSAIFCGV